MATRREAVVRQCIMCLKDLRRGSRLAENVCPRCRRETDNQTLEGYLALPPDALQELLTGPDFHASAHARDCRRFANEDLDCTCGADDADTTPELDFSAARG